MQRKDSRNRAILEEYNATRKWGRVLALSKKYKITPARIIHIVKATRLLVAREKREAKMKTK